MAHLGEIISLIVAFCWTATALFGDWCLFNCYLVIGARFGQLFMTLAPVMAAFSAWALLGETLTWKGRGCAIRS